MNMDLIYRLQDNATIILNQGFLAANFANDLFRELQQLSFEQPKLRMWGKDVPVPRLQSWMADPDVSSTDRNALKFADLTQRQSKLPWSPSVLKLKELLEKKLDCHFDYVLINQYRNGKDHISWHADKEAINKDKNIIASISLGATRKFVLRHIDWKTKRIPKKEFLLIHGSLIVMKDDTQKNWLHAVMKSKKVDKPRINLTFRRA